MGGFSRDYYDPDHPGRTPDQKERLQKGKPVSVRCEHCGAVASYGHELGHKSNCPSLRQISKLQKMTPEELAKERKRHREISEIISPEEIESRVIPDR